MINNAHYDRIVSPVITEKATLLLEQNKVVFKISKNATKPQIKAAIKALFGVDVIAVNTLVQRGKMKNFRGRSGRRPDYKKAIITLKEGQSIDMAAGL